MDKVNFLEERDPSRELNGHDLPLFLIGNHFTIEIAGSKSEIKFAI
jgi:hypothetical protein